MFVRTPSPPTARLSFLAKALVASAVLHACAISALAVWTFQAVTHSVRLGGEPIAIVCQPSEAETTLAMSPVSFEAKDEPVVIMPREARMAEHRFVETLSDFEPLAELFEPDELEILPIAVVAAAAPERREPTETPPSMRPSDPNDAPRLEKTQPTARPDASKSVASQVVPPVSIGNDATRPNFAGNRPPRYPDQARQQRIEGKVLLRLHISADGRVTDVEVATTSGHAILDAAAANAVRSWQGEPARRGGRPVATVELLPVRFQLPIG